VCVRRREEKNGPRQDFVIVVIGAQQCCARTYFGQARESVLFDVGGRCGAVRQVEVVGCEFIRRLCLATENGRSLTNFRRFLDMSREAVRLEEGRILYTWQDDYIAALAEQDPEKQRRLVYRAVAAIEQRRLSSLDADSEEHEALARAQRALEILKKSMKRG
jgi:hypothetical protein